MKILVVAAGGGGVAGEVLCELLFSFHIVLKIEFNMLRQTRIRFPIVL